MTGILVSLGQIINFALGLYVWLVIARVILSWVNPDPRNPIVLFLIRATEPLLAPLRRFLPAMGGIDLSPIVLFLGISFLQRLISILTTPSPLGAGVFARFFAEILTVVHLLVTLYLLLMVVRAVFSFRTWLAFRKGRFMHVNLGNPFVRTLFQMTEPVVRPLRAYTPTFWGLDVSPVMAALLIIALLLLIQWLVTFLLSGASLGLAIESPPLP